MTFNALNRHLIIAMLIVCGFNVHAQNLVPNPSFEIYNTCPTNVNNGEPLQCIPWDGPTDASPDYFNICATPSNAGVPTNLFGTQDAHTGVGYAGVGMWFDPFFYREYITAPLTQPLMADTAYEVSFYVSRAENSCGEDKIGAYFSILYPPNVGLVVLPFEPQVSSNLGIITNNTEWTLITGCFVAKGGEQFITIGNFFDDDEMNLDPNCNDPLQSYYYIDDVSVIKYGEPGMFDVELGDPVTGCAEYVIDPGLSGDLHYHWEDGSIDPTLTVNQSGTYAVTIFDGCAFGIDSLEVTIIPGQTVDAGPPVVDFCEGETYTVSLDPSLGDYTWQDGSHDTEYEITASGTYSVTLDDGCFPTSDEVEVTVYDPPPPFFLGADTSLCDGEEIQYNFDPALGTFHWQNGWSNPIYTIGHEGSYALTITNICGEFTDDIQVDYLQALNVDLGPDVILCEGDDFDIELDPTLGDFLWQDGSDQNTFHVTMPGTYSVTVTNPCESVSSNLNVLSSTEPVFDLGEDVTICNAQLPYHLEINNLTGVDFVWQDGSVNSQYLVNATGLYSVTVSNTCYTVTDEVMITTLNAVTNVILPQDLQICEDEPYVLTNSGDDGSYTWQDNSNADTLLITMSGTYSLTVSNDCGSASDEVQVDYLPPLTFPDLGNDVSLCPGDHITLHPPHTEGALLWNDMSTADTLLVTAPGTYAVQVSNFCSAYFDTIVVTFNSNPPMLSLPSTINLCQGDSLTIEAGIAGVSYLWNDLSQADSLRVINPGTYSLTVSNSCGMDMDTVIVVDGGNAPAIDLGLDVSICNGDSFLLHPVYSNVDVWLWQDGSIDTAYQITNSGIISVAVANACGSAADTLQVHALPDVPSFTLGPDSLVCPGTLITLEINISDVTIQWPDGSSGQQFNVVNPGTYLATISNSCGLMQDTFELFNLPMAPVLNLGIDQSLCLGEVITLDPGLQDVNYLWQDGSTDTIYQATQPGLITLTVSNQCGADTDSLAIILTTEGPQVNLGPDVLACEGEVVLLTSDISGVDYLWQDGSTSSSLSTTTSGTFVLQVSNNCGTDLDTVAVEIDGTAPVTELGADTILCEGESILLISTAPIGSTIVWQDGSSQSSFLVSNTGIYFIMESNHCGVNTDSITIAYLSPPIPIDIGSDTTLCEGETVLLQVSPTSDFIQWQDGSTASNLLVDTEGSYSVTVSNLCGSETDQVDVDFIQPPLPFDIGKDTTICLGETILLIAPAVNDALQWQDGSHGTSFIADQQQLYSLEISNACGTQSDQFSLSIDDHVPQADLPALAYLCPGEELELNVTQLFPATYLWNSGSSESSILVSQPGTYDVSILSSCGEKSLSTQVVTSDTCGELHTFFIPNVFSPNGDGINDLFSIAFNTEIEIQTLNVSIFDRWGNEIFLSHEKGFSWDGRFKNEDLMPGVYVYVLEVDFIDAGRTQHRVFSGDVTLVR